MQKLVQKAVFTALLVSSSAFAEGDLLSKATDGAVTTAKAEATEAKALSNGEMSDVKGGTIYVGVGSTYYNANTRAVYTPVTTNSSIYARAFGSSYWGRTYPGSGR